MLEKLEGGIPKQLTGEGLDWKSQIINVHKHALEHGTEGLSDVWLDQLQSLGLLEINNTLDIKEP